ncbi:hypothetical protein [Caulobacter segnis]|nr:hypothetical protein [Caulobacter segnis]
MRRLRRMLRERATI